MLLNTDDVRLASFAAHLDNPCLTMEDRWRFDKQLYLLYALYGIDLGYAFRWDAYGPTSRTLRKQLVHYVENKQAADTKAKQLIFRRRVSEQLQSLASATVNPGGIDRDDWLDLLTSIHYLAGCRYRTDANFRYSTEEDVPNEVALFIDEVLELKPHVRHVPRPVCEAAWQMMRPHIG